MKKIDLGQTINMLANVGALAGIVFLVVQVGQNNSLLEAEARSTRVLIRTDGWNRITDSPDLAPMLIRDRTGEPLSVEEELRLNAFWMTVLFRAEWEHESGLDNWIVPMRRQFETYGSFGRAWNADGSARSAGKDNFSAEFVRIVEEEVVTSP